MFTSPHFQTEHERAEFISLAIQFGVEQTILLRKTATHQVYRIISHTKSYILKWFHSPAQTIELKIYNILRGYGIPMLPVYAQTEHALILEDLQSSPEWRLADQSDLTQHETGKALAEWYLHLHQAGYDAVKRTQWEQQGVYQWVEQITTTALEKAGSAFQLANAPAWVYI